MKSGVLVEFTPSVSRRCFPAFNYVVVPVPNRQNMVHFAKSKLGIRSYALLLFTPRHYVYRLRSHTVSFCDSIRLFAKTKIAHQLTNAARKPSCVGLAAALLTAGPTFPLQVSSSWRHDTHITGTWYVRSTTATTTMDTVVVALKILRSAHRLQVR